ncbi:hypothetical protein IPG36_03280 [bacterium]|nr:MAG: hypothetical protein IPG36_03280 [bacterium]
MPAPAPVVQASRQQQEHLPTQSIGAAPTDPMTLVMKRIPPTAVVTNEQPWTTRQPQVYPASGCGCSGSCSARIQSGSAIAMPAADPAVVTQPMRQPQPLPQQLHSLHILCQSSALANEPIQSVATAVPAALPIASMQTRSVCLGGGGCRGGAGMARPAPPIGAPRSI